MLLYIITKTTLANKRIIERVNQNSLNLESLEFKGFLYTIKNDDLNYAFTDIVHIGYDIDLTPNNFIELRTRNFFVSNNNHFLITGSDLTNKFANKNSNEIFFGKTTQNQGYNFVNNLIDAYNSKTGIINPKKENDLPLEVPNSIIVFDPLIAMIKDPLPFLIGMNQAVSTQKNKSPKIYMFAGNMFR